MQLKGLPQSGVAVFNPKTRKIDISWVLLDAVHHESLTPQEFVEAYQDKIAVTHRTLEN